MSERVSNKPPCYVLDSFALLAYLENEVGAPLVQDILTKARQGASQVLISLINYGECIYIVERERGLPQTQAMIGMVDQLPITIVDVDRNQVLAAAHLKAHFPISYADAFAVSLAQQRQAILLTGDPEFNKVQHLITVQWLSQG